MRRKLARKIERVQKKLSDFPIAFTRERNRAGMVFGIVR